MEWIRNLPFHDLFLVLLLAVGTSLLWRWHRSDAPFDLQQLVVDNTSGKLSIEKVGYMTVLGITSWGMTGLFSTGKMTENYMTIYLSVFALARAASSGMSVLKDIKVPALPQSTSVTTLNVTTENKTQG